MLLEQSLVLTRSSSSRLARQADDEEGMLFQPSLKRVCFKYSSHPKKKDNCDCSYTVDN
jgi:hypothetical protein